MAMLSAAAMLYGTERRSGGERAKQTVSKGTVLKKKKKKAHLSERENGEEVPDCSCFSSHEKIAVWQCIKYSKL